MCSCVECHPEFEYGPQEPDAQVEIARLRQGLWDCFREAGGDTDGDPTPVALVSDIVPLVLDRVTELRSESPKLERWGWLHFTAAGEEDDVDFRDDKPEPLCPGGHVLPLYLGDC